MRKSTISFKWISRSMHTLKFQSEWKSFGHPTDQKLVHVLLACLVSLKNYQYAIVAISYDYCSKCNVLFLATVANAVSDHCSRTAVYDFEFKLLQLLQPLQRPINMSLGVCIWGRRVKKVKEILKKSRSFYSMTKTSLNIP